MKMFIACSTVMSCILTLTGCITASKYEKERVDQELTGNQGYILGKPASVVAEKKPQTRTVYEVEIEVPPLPALGKQTGKKNKEIKGNRGYIVGGPSLQIKQEESIPRTESVLSEMGVFKSEENRTAQVPHKKSTTYKVKKRDTLWNIAGEPEVYGNPLKWKRIYDANKSKIKAPDLIYPGQVLIIPRD